MLINELRSEPPQEEGAIIYDTVLVGISEWRWSQEKAISVNHNERARTLI